ncbi:MAG: hypothetical protein WAN22_29970, partial [Solirubrobacteraceae bacterium]
MSCATDIKTSGTLETRACECKPRMQKFATASGDEITRDEVERINRAFCASGQCTAPVGVVLASCSTASVIRRQAAAPSRSPSV